MNLNRFYRVYWRKSLDSKISTALTSMGIPRTTELVMRMKKAYVENDWNPDEYVLFHYEDLSPKARHSFVMQNEGFRFRRAVNPKNVHELFLDKGTTFDYFKDYYGREVVKILKKDCQKDVFAAFVEKNKNVIVKSLKEAGGVGVRIVKFADNQNNVSVLYEDLWKNYPEGFLLEQIIIQSNELSVFHPKSVNTIRLTTYKYNGNVELIHRSFVRFGQGNAVVDNGAQGGIMCSIDFESGIVTAAMDEFGNCYLVHPDSGKTIIGFQIPQWKEAKEMAITLMGVIPDARYVGWDLALTDKGWVMVEGNSKGLFIGFQLPNQKGWREEFEMIKEKMNIQSD